MTGATSDADQLSFPDPGPPAATSSRSAGSPGGDSGWADPTLARGLLDSLPAQIVVLDAEGRIVVANKAWRAVAEVAGAAPIAEGYDYLASCDRAAESGALDAAEFARAIREVLSGRRQDFTREYVLPTPGAVRWFEGRVVRFHDDGPPRVVVAHFEVTDRHRARDAARTLNDRLRVRLERSAAIRRVDVAIASGLDLERVLDLLVSEARTLLHVDAVNILRLTPSSALETVRSFGLSPVACARPLEPATASLPGRVVARNRPVGVADLRLDPEADPRSTSAIERGLVAYRAVPLRSRGGPLGVLEVFLRSGPPDDHEWTEFLETLADQTTIAFQNARFAEETQRSHRELALACEATIEGWSRALEMRDKETQGHSQRVTEMTLRLARELGLDDDQLVQIRRGALLHDIGKMGVPDRILLKPGPLSPDEWAVMRMHPTFALRMLWPIEFLRPALEIPYAHHERWDGSGYPRGLVGEEIPLSARIFAVVDLWDALGHDRPYRPAWPADRVRDHLQKLAGTQLDPNVVAAFLRCQPVPPGPTPERRPAVAIELAESTPLLQTIPFDGAESQGPTVLIAEHNIEVANLLGLILNDAGFHVLHARDGHDAWRIARREDVSIVLADWSIPGLDGPELCRQIRRREEQPYTYVILLTDLADTRNRLEGMRAGADDFLAKPIDPTELIARLEIARRILGMQRTILERSAQAERFAAELQVQNQRLTELAWTDGLTGLCNRRRFLDALDAQLSLAARRSAPLSIALLDVDRFKQYNDAHGHQAGDEVLRQVAEILRRTVRAHDLPARHGGEEFIVMLPETDPLAALTLAERLRAAIDDHPWPLRPVTASLGVATAEDSLTRDPAILVEHADRALYRSKHLGRNRVSHYVQILTPTLLVPST